MSRYRDVFPGRHTLLCVVHSVNQEQSLRNSRIARDNGADGVFLINHDFLHPKLLEIHNYVREQLLDFWIGLNCLDLGRSAIHRIPLDTMGLWVDNAGIEEGSTDPTSEAKIFRNKRNSIGWKGICFGGVAFKHQAPVVSFATVAQLARPLVDVITTSGDRTGVPPNPNKIRIMKEANGDHPLAIASGITPENVGQYMPFADCFLVATGISRSATELDPKRVRELARVLGK